MPSFERLRAAAWNLRRRHAELASLGLDWDAPPYPPAGTNAAEPPVRVEILTEPQQSRPKKPAPDHPNAGDELSRNDAEKNHE